MFKVMKIVEAHLLQAEQKLTLVKQVKGRKKTVFKRPVSHDGYIRTTVNQPRQNRYPDGIKMLTTSNNFTLI